MAGLIEAIAKGACKAARKSKEYTDREIAKVNEKLGNASDSVADLLSYSLKGSEIGESIALDDVNPINVKVRAKITSETLANGTAVTVKTCGKNFFNPSKLLEMDGCTEKNGVYSFAGDTFYYAFRTNAKPLIDHTFFEEGKQYTISFDGKHESDEGNPSVGMCFLYEDGTCSNAAYINSNTKKRYTLTSDAGKKIVGLHSDIGWDYNVEMSNIICCDGIDTVYEPYIEGETITASTGETVSLATLAPCMTIATDTEGAILSVEYVKDPNIVIQKFTNAFISLGGNI